MPTEHDSPPSIRPAVPAMTRDEAEARIILGIDWGERRIGLAIKPAGQDWPLPKGVMEVRSQPEAIERLREVIVNSGAEAVVVGLPIHPDGRSAAVIKRFCRKARSGRRGVRWFFVDERLTTEEADSIKLKGGGGRPSDDLAAVLILETFLQTCR